MDALAGLNMGLGALPLLSGARTRSVSAENPTGEKGMGGMAVPDVSDGVSSPARALVQGWKVRPCIWLKSGETTTLMDVEGPGVIQHIWMVTGESWNGSGRGCVLRFYWDGEDTPSVEVPLTDFFAVGHDLFAPVNSLAVIVNPTSALNCFWPMPFRRHARVTITNDWEEDVRLFYQITFAENPVPENAGYFHAQWRRAVTERSKSRLHDLGRCAGSGSVCRHVLGVDAAVGRLVRRGRDQVLHGRRSRISDDLRHGNGRLLFGQLRFPGGLQHGLRGQHSQSPWDQRTSQVEPVQVACPRSDPIR